MKRTIENADGIYPCEVMSRDELLADLTAGGIVDPLDVDVQLPEIRRDAHDRATNAPDPAIRTDAEMVLTLIRVLRRGTKELLETPALSDLQREYAQAIVERAIGFALVIGRLDERCHARQFEHNVRHSLGVAKTATAGKKKAAQNDYDKINQAVAAHQKKRGRRKEPSNTQIRHLVADELGFTYSKVLAAWRWRQKKVVANHTVPN